MAFLLLAPAITDALGRSRALRNLVRFSEDISQWSPLGVTVSAPLGLNALNGFTGYSVASGGQGWHGAIAFSQAVEAGDVLSVRLFYRAGSSGAIRLCVRYTDENVTHHNLLGPPGALPDSAGSIERISETLQSDGLTYEGIFRITVIRSSDLQFRIGPNSDVTGQDVILLAAQLEAGSTATPYQATP